MAARKLTDYIIHAAIQGFESQKTTIDQQIAELRAMLSGGSTETASTPEDGEPRKRKKFSASARKRMSEAQRARWASDKGTSEQPEQASSEASTPQLVKAKKRRMSAAGRKAISEATKQRWALKRAAEAAKVAPAKKPASKKPAAKKSRAKKASPVAIAATA
jgi:hypothetical protein